VQVVADAYAVEQPLVLRGHQLAVLAQNAPGRSRSRSLTPTTAWMPCRSQAETMVETSGAGTSTAFAHSGPGRRTARRRAPSG
jgi:hypothetical protein